MASAARKPACTATGAKRGQRSAAAVRSWLTTGWLAVEAVQARAFVGLQFEQLDDAHRLVRRRHRLQLAVGGGQHDAGCGDVEDLDAAVRQAW